jgi:hypothetical protein
MTKGSDLLVRALENEGVERIFGIPGEENLDVVESLRTSKIELVLTRHEQENGAKQHQIRLEEQSLARFGRSSTLGRALCHTPLFTALTARRCFDAQPVAGERAQERFVHLNLLMTRSVFRARKSECEFCYPG